MPAEVSIYVDVDATGHYGFRVRSGTREITTSLNPELATSFYEDLRLLRWKSVGVHDPGDTLLNHVGDRLAALIAPPATWKEVRLPDGADTCASGFRKPHTVSWRSRGNSSASTANFCFARLAVT